MRYMFLIYDEETGPDHFKPEIFPEYEKFSRQVRQRAAFVAGDALQPTATSTTVRVRDGAALTTDGPFAETKEQLGGYYILDCADLDEALAYAAQIPSATYGSVEVRPLASVAREHQYQGT